MTSRPISKQKKGKFVSVLTHKQVAEEARRLSFKWYLGKYPYPGIYNFVPSDVREELTKLLTEKRCNSSKESRLNNLVVKIRKLICG